MVLLADFRTAAAASEVGGCQEGPVKLLRARGRISIGVPEAHDQASESTRRTGWWKRKVTYRFSRRSTPPCWHRPGARGRSVVPRGRMRAGATDRGANAMPDAMMQRKRLIMIVAGSQSVRCSRTENDDHGGDGYTERDQRPTSDCSRLCGVRSPHFVEEGCSKGQRAESLPGPKKRLTMGSPFARQRRLDPLDRPHPHAMQASFMMPPLPQAQIGEDGGLPFLASIRRRRCWSSLSWFAETVSDCG
jgi:hypothetical protein